MYGFCATEESGMSTKIVFMGSDELSCRSLDLLMKAGDVTVVGVVTQPDRPKGRKRNIQACDLKQHALDQGARIISLEKISSDEGYREIEGLKADLFTVVAYGQYIPQRLLALPPLGAINLHPSLLPKYRGASPIQSAILSGETETGVSIIRVAREMDAGDILAQTVVPIDPYDTAIELGARLSQLGAELLLDVIRKLSARADLRPMPQDSAEATYAGKITKEDARLDWNRPAGELNNAIRAFQPWPVAHCEAPAGSGQVLRIFKARIEDNEAGAPGEVIHVDSEGPLVRAGSKSLRLLEVQPEGRKRMPGSAFVCGRYISTGSFLA